MPLARRRLPWHKVVRIAGAFLSLAPVAASADGWSIPSTGEGTGEKPQSKLWYNDATWRAILKREGYGLHFYEFDGTQWSPSAFMDARLGASGTADVKWNGEELFILTYSSRPKLFKYTYDRVLRVFHLAPGFPVSIPIASGSETMVIDQDTTGRLWAAYEAGQGAVFVCWSTSADHREWASPGIVLRDGVNEDDIASIVAFDAKVGVFWSDQNRDQFGFRVHRDGDAPEDWSAVEVVASGSGIADDHLCVKAAGNGDVYAVTKDDHDSMRLHLRRAATGKWTTKTGVIAGSGTRGIIQVSDDDSKIYVAYTNWSSSDLYVNLRSASYSSLSFSTAQSRFISGAPMNNCTGTKQVLPRGCLMVMCEGGGHTWWNGWGELPPDGPPPPPPPAGVVATPLAPPRDTGHGTPLALDLPLDEGSGTTARDASASGAEARLAAASGKTTLPAWTPGRSGTALRFDGDAAYVTVPSSEALRIPGSFTVEAWVRWDSGSNPGTVLSKGLSNRRNYQLLVRSDGRIDFKWEVSGGANHGVVGSRSLTRGAWHHVACVYDQAAGRSRIYLDGRQDASIADAGTPVLSDDPLLLGMRLSSSGQADFFAGALDDVRVWRGVRYDADFVPETPPRGSAQYEPVRPSVRVTWESPASDKELRYHVFRSANGGPATRLTGSTMSSTTYTDADPVAGLLCYEVVAVDTDLRSSRPSADACIRIADETLIERPDVARPALEAAAVGPQLALFAHPNPFNPATRLLLVLPEAGRVRVGIYDVAGRLVASLHEGRLPAGAHRFDFRPDRSQHVHSGVFLARVEAAGRTLHHKLVLVQ